MCGNLSVRNPMAAWDPTKALTFAHLRTSGHHSGRECVPVFARSIESWDSQRRVKQSVEGQNKRDPHLAAMHRSLPQTIVSRDLGGCWCQGGPSWCALAGSYNARRPCVHPKKRKAKSRVNICVGKLKRGHIKIEDWCIQRLVRGSCNVNVAHTGVRSLPRARFAPFLRDSLDLPRRGRPPPVLGLWIAASAQ
jgi:hypothetical protein